MTLNRKTAPAFHLVEKLGFAKYEKLELKNGSFLYSLKAGTQEVIRLDLIFSAGLIHQLNSAEASFTASMLSEGTSQLNAKELANSLDYFGSYFQTRSNPDDAVATLYCLEKHLKSCLPIFLQAITDSILPEKELEIQKKNSIQKLLVNEKKNSYLCRKNFYKTLLGEQHPYAAFSNKEDIQTINSKHLRTFYKEHYLNGFKYALLSGQFSENTKQTISNSIGETNLINRIAEKPKLIINTSIGKQFIDKEESIQSAIRIGKTSILRNHPDYRKLQFLNLIFGGYFGSRLMKNIREDKGLTYGIYSVLEPFKETSVWYIETEINNKNRNKGIEEIYSEMKKIREQEIPKVEIENARNYYLGSFLRSLDGPFSLADRLKIMIDNSLSDSYYPEFVETLNSLKSSDLSELANKYLNEENIVEVVIGKK
jgi:predicted Zn-dependent peptidase